MHIILIRLAKYADIMVFARVLKESYDVFQGPCGVVKCDICLLIKQHSHLEEDEQKRAQLHVDDIKMEHLQRQR